MANELKFGNKVIFLNGYAFTLPMSGTDPTPAVAGDFYYNSVSQVVKYYNGTIWVSLATGAAAASTALDNLAAVAINTSLLPGVNASINLGSASKSWLAANIALLKAADASTSIDVYSRVLKDSAGASQLTWGTFGVSFPQLTASTVPYLDAGKILTSSAVTPTELGYLSGVTSAIQTQLNGKLNLTGGTLSGALDLGSNQIHNVADPTSPQDAATQAYVLSQIAGAGTPLTNYLYVDSTTGNDTTGNGSMAKPFLTLGKVATVIGAATNSTTFNDATKRYYVIKAVGIFTESPVFGTRPHIILDMQAASLVGDLTVQFNQGVSGGTLSTPKFIVYGADLRGLAGSAASTGITGNVFYESITTGSSLVAQLQFLNTSVSGAVHQRLGSGGGTFTLTHFVAASILGSIVADSGVGGMTLYAQHCDTSSSNAIGAVSGPVQIYQIHNVRFNGPVVVTGTQGGRWFDVEFKAGQAHDFSGASGTTSADANSYESFKANVPTGFNAVAFTLLDTARGVAYPPATPGNWSSVPNNVASALDTLAADAQGYAKINGTRTWTANQPMGGFKFTGLGAGSTAGDSVRYEQVILVNGANAFTANQPMGGFKLTGLAAGTTAGDSVRYEQVILANGTNAFTANQSFGGFKATNMADPTSAQDGATKAYVDAVAQGMKPKAAVKAASLANVNLASMPATLDGFTLTSGDRILIKNQTSSQDNGIYIFNGTGSAATRSTDMDSLSPIDEVNGAYTFIQNGTQAGQGWVEQSVVVTLGTSPMVWVYFNDVTTVIGGDMITVTGGTTISVDLATASGLESTNPGNVAGQLRIKLEASNPSLKFTGSNELAVKLDPAGTITSGASGLIVGVDNSTIAISSNQLIVKSGGITNTQVAAGAAIALTKLAALTANRALASDASGFIVVSATTDTELGFLSGVTSSVQTQLNGKANTALSNLASTAVNVSIIPGSDLAINLGTASLRWSNVFAAAVDSGNTPLVLKTTASNASVVVNANGSGNFDIEATKMRRSQNGADSTNFMEDQYFDALTLAANTSSATEISASLSFALANYDSAIIEYKIKEATSNKVRVGQFIVTTDSTIASSSDQFSETGILGSALGLVLTADVSGGNVRILYNNTNASNAATMRCNIRRLRT